MEGGDAMRRSLMHGPDSPVPRSSTAVGFPRARGVTLIETLVALLVIGIGLLGLAGLQTVSMQYNHSSFLRTQANNFAYDIADRMRANRSAALNGDYDVTIAIGGSAPGGASVAANDLQQWWAFVDAALPQAQATITVTPAGTPAGTATINIQWLDDRDQNAANARSNLQLNTRI